MQKRTDFRWQTQEKPILDRIMPFCSIASARLQIEDALGRFRCGGNKFNISTPATEREMQDNVNLLKNMLLWAPEDPKKCVPNFFKVR